MWITGFSSFQRLGIRKLMIPSLPVRYYGLINLKVTQSKVPAPNHPPFQNSNYIPHSQRVHVYLGVLTTTNIAGTTTLKGGPFTGCRSGGWIRRGQRAELTKPR